MSSNYRVIFETYDNNNPSDCLSRSEIITGEINKPTNCLDFSIGLSKQIDLIQGIQDKVLQEKANKIAIDQDRECPSCKIKLYKCGTHSSTFYDTYSEHEIVLQRFKCKACAYETPSTITTLIGGKVSGDLKRIQATLGATQPFRESERIFELFSNKDRKINNHDRIKKVVESVGKEVSNINDQEKEILSVFAAEELIVNIDGGHINTTEEGKRSFEAMTSVIYRPEALVSNEQNTRNHLTSKHCAASAKSDNNQQIINNTIVAAIKQGLSLKTKVTALCDGAANCWSVVEALRPLALSVLCILDWFHLSMKIQNIALPEMLKPKLTRIKWHLWRGRTDNAIIRLDSLIEEVPKNYQDRLNKLKTYIENNADKIVNYRDRQKQKLVFTSNLAESTVESLINQRCKGQQHMRWSREGIEPLLQLRAAIASNDWNNKWQTAVLNAA